MVCVLYMRSATEPRSYPVLTPFNQRSIECGSRVRSGVEAQGGRLQVGFSTSSSRRTEASLALGCASLAPPIATLAAGGYQYLLIQSSEFGPAY